MEFKSRTALAQHFKQLLDEGWITSEWIIKHTDTNTIGNRMFKINFDNVKKPITSLTDSEGKN